MEITLTKEGKKIVHPSGVENLYTLKKLQDLESKHWKRINLLNVQLTGLQLEIAEIKSLGAG